MSEEEKLLYLWPLLIPVKTLLKIGEKRKNEIDKLASEYKKNALYLEALKKRLES